MRELRLTETLCVSAADGLDDSTLMINSMAMSLCGGLLMLFLPYKIDLSFSGGILKNMILFPLGAITGGILGPLLTSQAYESLTKPSPTLTEQKTFKKLRIDT